MAKRKNFLKKNKKTIITISGLVIGVFFLALFGNTLLSVVGVDTEIGWTPVAHSIDGYSDSGKGVIWSSGCRDGRFATPCTKRFDSKYWSFYSTGSYDNSGSAFWLENPQLIFEERTNDFTFESPVSIPRSLDGGDGYLKTAVAHNGGVKITFNEDLKNKYFKVNYDSDYYIGGDGSSPPIIPNTIMGHEFMPGTSGVVEIKPSLFEEGKAELYINGEKVEDLIYPYELTAVIKGVDGTNWQKGYITYFEFKNPRYNELFDCSIDNDEVLVFDEFTGGSLFDINSLTYTEPLPKFCPNSQPVIVRSFTERGLTTDYNNEVFHALASGDSFRVPEDQTIRVPYVTKDTTGELRCPLNQAYNTKTNNCQDILSEGLEEDYTPYTSDISIGENDVSYTMEYNSLSSIKIGDLSFSTSAPRFVCDCDEGRTTPPNPSNSCWETDIGDNVINTKQTTELAPYTKLYYEVEGIGVYKGYTDTYGYLDCQFMEEDHWTNKYRLTIDSEGLSIEESKTLTSVMLNKDESVELIINNEIASFSNSGLLVRTYNEILDTYNDNEISLALDKSKNTYDYKLKTDILGNVEQEIIPYIIVDDKKIYASKSLILKYSVTDDGISDITTGTTDNSVEEPTSDPIISFDSIKENLSPLVIILSLVVGIILITILIISLKRK